MMCATLGCNVHAATASEGGSGDGVAGGETATGTLQTTQASQATQATQALWLAVTLNGVAREGLFPFVLSPDGDLGATPDTLHRLGVRWLGALPHGLASVSRTPGVVATYDEARQQVSIVVPAHWLEAATQQYDAGAAQRATLMPGAPATGVLLNYDVYGQRVDTKTAVSATTQLDLFSGGAGRLTSGMLSHWSSGPSGGSGAVRLDTTWIVDNAPAMSELSVGDYTSGALDWSRSVRMAGVRIARSFALQPYTLTTPLPGFAGTAVLPSTVDLYINGMKQATQSVLPGPFQISNVPSINGAGQAQMVITDINGATRTIAVPLYVSAQLLRAGLSDWSAELGTLRRNYGIDSFSYGHTPVFSGSLRYGFTNALTLEAHAEARARLALAGGGVTWLVGQRAGVLSTSLATSHSPLGEGMQGSLGYQWSGELLNLYGSVLRRSTRYQDVGALDGATLALVSDTAFVGINARWAQVGVSWLQQRYPDQPMQRYVSLSMSRTFSGRASVSMNLERSLGGSGTGVFASLSLPLERYSSYSVSASHNGSSNALTLGAVRSVPDDTGGWGWRAQAGEGNTRSAQAEASYLGRDGQVTAGASEYVVPGVAPVTTLYGELTGAVIAMGAAVHASRHIDDAFALVDTSGVPGVPVRFQNRLVGVTDAQGQLLVNHLNAYQHNTLSIDTLNLPADVRVASTQTDAVPGLASGVLVRFDLTPVLGVQLALKDPRGVPVAPGSVVQVRDARGALDGDAGPAIVGYDGVVYLENPPALAVLRVSLPDGSRCEATLPAVARRRGLVNLDRVTCWGIGARAGRRAPDAPALASLAPRSPTP